DSYFYNKGIDFTDYGNHQPSTPNFKDRLFELHPHAENEPGYIKDHRDRVGRVEERRREVDNGRRGANFLFLSPTTGGLHSPSHLLDPSSPAASAAVDASWQRANQHNPWFHVVWPKGEQQPTRLGYDYTKGGYSWGGYGTFGAIDIWEEEEEDGDADDNDKEDDEDPFEAAKSTTDVHKPDSIVPPLLPILDH
ncbi:hypothetical protein PFISCL1PPCAC_4106, partial [Pristionchus fissidentatus]